MSKMKLFNEESEDEEVSLKTNNEYAKRYDNWREKEELHKLEQKYGPKALNSDASLSSDSEDESDEPPEVSEEMEAQFLKTLALLKTKDPRIYDPNFKFFENDQQKEEEKKPKIKQLTFDDSDDEDNDNDGNIFTIEKKAPEIMNVEKNDEEFNDKKASKAANEKDGKLKEYLTGKVEHIDESVERDLAPLKALWSDPKLNEGEAFLRDYILNKRYLEEGGVGEAEDKLRDDEELEADEQRVEEQGQFERAYNFRFEEPDQEFLKRYPRTMNYIRPKDDKRARVRAERAARKEEEKRKKMEEIGRLKAFKLKEIQEKIARIKEVTGNQDLAFEEQDIEGDFDPEEHDRRMKAVFDEQYYGEADDEKPVFPDLDEELEIENWEKYDEEQTDGQNENGPHCEDEDFNMDADYDPKKAKENLLEELKKNMGKKRRNRKKKSKLAQVLEAEKPKFVPTVTDRTYSEYMEEYYKMDCEDIIGGDLPTRFKYREVVPNDYGLTVEEILLADDKELTQWVPLKKLVKYRPEHIEKGEVKTYAQKAADEKLKKKVLPSLFKNLPEEPEMVIPAEEANKEKKKKKKNKKKNGENGIDRSGNIEEIRHTDPEEIVENTEQIDDSLEVKPKKKKKKHINSEINRQNDSLLQGDNKQVEETSSKEKKKKKKKHKNGDFIVKNADIDGENHEDGTTQADDSKKEKKKYRNPEQNVQENNLKRKLEMKTDQVPQKKNKHKTNQDSTNNADGNVNKSNKHHKNNKFKQKGKMNKNNNKSMDNSLDKLSDERLKAYGLNPKKYRSFLKYKKF